MNNPQALHSLQVSFPRTPFLEQPHDDYDDESVRSRPLHRPGRGMVPKAEIAPRDRVNSTQPSTESNQGSSMIHA